MKHERVHQVLPILEEQLGHAEQRSMVWETLKEMPLRLLERVMPWLAGRHCRQPVCWGGGWGGGGLMS